MKKKAKKNITEEKMDLLDTKNKEDIYKIKKKTKAQKEDEKDIYEKYRVEDLELISQSSSEDIETKINEMIQIKKKGGSLQDYIHKKEMNKLQQMKMVSNKFQQQKDKKQQQKKEERLMRLKKGLENLEMKLPKIMRNMAFRRMTKRLIFKNKIELGLISFKKFYNIRTRKIKKNNFNKFISYFNENKVKKIKDKKESKDKNKEDKNKKDKNSKEKKEKNKKGIKNANGKQDSPKKGNSPNKEKQLKNKKEEKEDEKEEEKEKRKEKENEDEKEEEKEEEKKDDASTEQLVNIKEGKERNISKKKQVKIKLKKEENVPSEKKEKSKEEEKGNTSNEKEENISSIKKEKSKEEEKGNTSNEREENISSVKKEKSKEEEKGNTSNEKEGNISKEKKVKIEEDKKGNISKEKRGSILKEKIEIKEEEKKGNEESKLSKLNSSPRKRNISSPRKSPKKRREGNKGSIKLTKKENIDIIDNKDNKGDKINTKKKKLEDMKEKEENYIHQVNLTSLRRFEEMKLIDEQINKQKTKFERLKEGQSVSETDSNISFELGKEALIDSGLMALTKFISKYYNPEKKKLLNKLTRSQKKRKTTKKFDPQYIQNRLKMHQSNNAVDKVSKKNVRDITKHQTMKKTKLKEIERNRDKQIEEKDEEDESYINEESEKSEFDDTFVKMNRLGDIEKPVDKSQLVEYDLFYKEQFFKDEVFRYDINNIQDKEVQEINHEMNKLDVKRKLIAKKKEKDVQVSKGLNTDEIDQEIAKIEKEYIKAKTIEKPKLDLIMNNTEGLLYKGRLLGCYFNGSQKGVFPRFAMESEKEIGAKEVIDFKILRKEEQARRFFDYCCCMEERKKINKWLVYARFWCRFFVDNWIFDNLSLLIIILNTVLILISDPTDSNNLGNTSDQYFLYFYTIEAILKIISFKFWSAEDAYIKDYWNILDFFVVLVGWISFVIERLMNGTKISGLAGLRAFRILRPLKTVKRFKGLKKLVTALLASIAHLGETTIVLIFFFLIFAIAGRQMWMGNFYRRCMNVNYGYLYSFQKSNQMCSFDSDCNELNTYGMRFICAKGYQNPDSGAINFDNTLTGFVTIFVMVTLEGWTNVFTYVSKTFKDKIFINPIIIFFYFHFFIFIGAFYLINLFLAVTNSEFEHIETERKLLQEKKSFYKLLMSKFDLKEKEKIDKKERNKKKKENNNRKSDQALVDLYYKVKDDAFHINKNKRNIPILYSTVQDIYIMSNNNPEELYLQNKRIDEEESFLGKDIKRQQREIDELIDEKRREMKLNLKEKKKEEKKEAENIEKINTTQSKIKTNKSIKSTNSNIKKNNSGGHSSLKNNSKYTDEVNKNNILKMMSKINPEMVKDAINNTLETMKKRKETVNQVTKAPENKEEEERDALRRKIEKKELKKAQMNQIKIEEDLPYEKVIRKINEKRKKEKEEKAKQEEKKQKINKFKSKQSKGISEKYKSKVMTEKNMVEKTNEQNKELIADQISFLTDLSLPNMNQSFSQFKRANSIKDSSEEDKNNESNSEIDQNDIIITKEKSISNANNKLDEKVSFQRPRAILNSIIKLKDDIQIQKKLKRLRDKFNLDNFLKKQERRGTNLKNVGKRKSFLKFLQYTSEPDNLEEYLKNNNNNLNIDENNNSNEINSNTNDNLIENERNNFLDLLNSNEESKNNREEEYGFNNPNISFLSRDSHISIDQNDISMNDINLIPDEIKEGTNLFGHTMNAQNLSKNLKGNKFIHLIRSSIFDRKAVNTNIDLTSKEQSRYFGVMNKNLNKNLYVDKNEPRGRKPGDLDVSHIASEKNYEGYLRGEEEIEQNFKSNDNNENNEDNEYNETNKNNISPIREAKTFKKKEIKIEEPQISHRKTVSKNFNIKTLKSEAAHLEELSHNNLHLDSNDNENQMTNKKKKNAFYIFKAKSIEKNMDKYPKENSNDLCVKEQNKPYTDPLTIIQESIPDNLRGKKYYMNYLYNISDKDLKVKDTFKVDHWVNEILGKKEKYIKKKPLPESVEAFFVFNDKNLNLKKYKYSHHQDYEYTDKECAFLTHNLKYLPRSVLEIMPLRLRNFGKFAAKKEIKVGTLGDKPNSMNIMNLNKSQVLSTNTRSGKTFSTNIKNNSSLIMSSAFTKPNKINEEVKYKKALHEKVYKKINEFNYNTLANYFTEEEDLFSKFIDGKRKEEKMKEVEKENNEKENRLIVKDEIVSIQIYDLKTNSNRYVQWSGPDVLSNTDEYENRKRWNKIIDALEDFNMIIWHANPAVQRMQKLRYAFYVMATNDIFDYIVLSIVIINSVFMALDGNIIKPEILNGLNISNYIFNAIFFLEYVVKFIGLSPLTYYSDAFTYLDTVIIAFAILDMATPSNTDDEQVGSKKSVSSQLSFLRVFRIFRVIRLTKILRRLKSMRLIIVSMKKALASVSYIVCILVMFILIFELLGMSLLSGNIHYQEFGEGFFITYQILTLENWDGLLYELWPMNNLCFFYFVVWIFLGNYIIFNLFTSVLLQSFGQDEDDGTDDLTDDEIVENMYALPDYLYAIKKSEKEHKKITKLFRRANQQETYKETTSTQKEEENYNDDDNNLSLSKNLAKSQISNSSRKSSIAGISMISADSESRILDDENNEASSEDSKVHTGIDKQMREWAAINKLFRKNECENAFYVLSQTNKFRIFCLKAMNNKWFDRFILVMILLSTLRLILDTFFAGYIFVLIFDYVDAFFNAIFLLEAIVKICALGFVMDEGSYLRDNWNKIDIIIVVCSIFDFENLIEKYLIGNQSSSSLQFLKVLRLLRTLRPLRFISHNVQLKLIITSLFDSILPICNALFIVLVVYYMFSIVGISLFYENLHNCYVMKSDGSFDLAIGSFENNLADYEISNDMPSISNFCASKYNGIMDTGPAFKFSNIATSIITSYVLSTQEGWPDIMNSYRIYGDVYGAFFIIYNLVVAYFFLNLFTGIMFRYFNAAFSKEQKLAEDDKKAPKYYDFLTQIYRAESDYVTWVRPTRGTFKYYLREFADSSFLDNFIMGCIFLNMVSMAMNYENCHENYNQALTIVNYVFTGIFIAECVLKLLAYFPRAYFHSAWNRFDFFVVVASIIDLVVANIDGIDAAFLKSFQIIRVLRVLRVTRVLRLVKALKGLEKLIQTLTWSVSALANVFLLMIIIFCIFAILGCYFYDGIVYENYKSKFTYLNEYYNVDNFYTSFLLTFRCATGESWPNIMMELAFVNTEVVSEAYAYIYMILSNFVNSIIMLNLFLMVTLQQYDEFTNKSYNPIEKFESFLIDFNNAWNKYSTPEDDGFRIKKGLVINFFMDYNWKKLNFPEKGKLEYVKKFVSDLKLRSDSEDFVYYHDVICKIIIRQLGSQVDKENPDNALILRTEKKVQEEVRNLIDKYLGKKDKDKKGKGKKNIITYNPLTVHLYFKISYQYIKTFIDFYKENLRFMSQYEDEPSGDSQLIDDDNKVDNIGSERPLNHDKKK